MRTAYWTMYTLLGATLVLTVCAKDDKGPPQPKESEETTSLVVLDDADQTTTRNVSPSITSPVIIRAAIYTDESYTNTSLLVELPVFEVAKNIRLDVAEADRALYIQYATSKGKEMMNIPLNAVSMRVETLVKLPENASGFDTSGGEGAYRY